MSNTHDDIIRDLGIGSLDKAATDSLYGLKYNSNPSPVKVAKDNPGLTFVVRPALALTDANIKRNSELADLDTTDMYSEWAYIRGLLDPHYAVTTPGAVSHLLDTKQAFIPFITNNVIGVSGWRSESLATRETSPGLMKEQLVLPDGIINYFGNFDLDITVKNSIGSPVDKLLYVWEQYIGLNMLANIEPYPWHMANKQRDYTTRIYRLVLSEDGVFVRHIAATAASFPVNNEMGKLFDYNKDSSYQDITGDRTIRLASSAPIYDDFRIVEAFNWVVGVFHPGMRDLQWKVSNNKDIDMWKVPRNILPKLNYRMYPHINILTYELEWYIDKEYVEEIKSDLGL